MMLVPRDVARVFAAPPLPADGRRREPDRDRALGVGALAEGVDLVREQPRVTLEDLGEGRVDGPEERVDGAVALGRGTPVADRRIR